MVSYQRGRTPATVAAGVNECHRFIVIKTETANGRLGVSTGREIDGSDMGQIRIDGFEPAMLAEVATMLARAFVTNPMHIVALGPDALDKNEAFFRAGLVRMKGTKRIALDAERIVGFIHWVPSPDCQFSAGEKVGLLPAMIGGLGPRSSWRVSNWLAAWSAKDPGEPHVHLGPIGVDTSAQRRGVGDRLMRAYCDHLDDEQQAGYLETDRPGNVPFYRRFGFEVVEELPVLGVPNFLMRRASR